MSLLAQVLILRDFDTINTIIHITHRLQCLQHRILFRGIPEGTAGQQGQCHHTSQCGSRELPEQFHGKFLLYLRFRPLWTAVFGQSLLSAFYTF